MSLRCTFRKQVVFLVVVSIMAASALGLTRAVGDDNQPAMVIPVKQYDAGTHWQGETVSHTYEVRNEGTAELTIVRVKPG